ncbi:hypothetical protein [Pseudosulfitobacter sp. SM2401]|uniref:hypothetical protein n=1 Tax=Pseudosulfitobacter sp. SM2401 TaxID=3350098 RepID=UPI0036F44B68
MSLKSTFPNYSALRADFSERLDKVTSENTRMLLNTLTPPDTVPTVSVSDLRDVSDAKEEALNAWDARLRSIREQGKREREIGLGAEEFGLVPGPIVRDPTGAAEFIDANGEAWDVKGFRSDFPASSGGFEIGKAMDNVEKELNAGHNVIIDTGRLSVDDLSALRAEIERRGFSDRVVYRP